MSSQWYYAQDGKQFGPVTAAELKELAGAGQLRPNDLVWREGMRDWAPAASLLWREGMRDWAPASSVEALSSPLGAAYGSPPPPPWPRGNDLLVRGGGKTWLVPLMGLAALAVFATVLYLILDGMRPERKLVGTWRGTGRPKPGSPWNGIPMNVTWTFRADGTATQVSQVGFGPEEFRTEGNYKWNPRTGVLDVNGERRFTIQLKGNHLTAEALWGVEFLFIIDLERQ